MNNNFFILIPIFEAGLSTTEYVLEYIKRVKKCKTVRTDLFPLTSIISNPSILCDQTVWDILATMFRGFDVIQNESYQDSLYDIFRCCNEELRNIVKQLTGYMLYRTAKPLAKKIVGSDIGKVLTHTRSMDYMYLILSMIWVPVVVECNHNGGKRTPQLQKFSNLSKGAFEMVKLRKMLLKRNSTIKVWSLKREFHKWAFDVLSGKPFEEHPEAGPTNKWAIFTKFANEVAVELLEMNFFEDTSQKIEMNLLEEASQKFEFVDVEAIEHPET